MSCILLGLAVLTVADFPPVRGLQIEDIRTAYSPLGPERKTPDYCPNDVFCVRYTITGITTNVQGRIDLKATLTLTDAEGTRFGDADRKYTAHLVFGDALALCEVMRLPGDLKPGVYCFTVSVRDNVSQASTSFKRTFRVGPTRLAITSPRFSYDPDGKYPAPFGGLVGQTVYCRFSAVGLDWTSGKVDAALEAQVMDAAGKLVLSEKLKRMIRETDVEGAGLGIIVHFQGPLALHRTGDFIVRFVVTDHLTKKTATFDAPLRITAP